MLHSRASCGESASEVSPVVGGSLDNSSSFVITRMTSVSNSVTWVHSSDNELKIDRYFSLANESEVAGA